MSFYQIFVESPVHGSCMPSTLTPAKLFWDPVDVAISMVQGLELDAIKLQFDDNIVCF